MDSAADTPADTPAEAPAPRSVPETPADLLALAARHGLGLTEESVEFVDFGLDYQVALADDDAGQRWVLRIPRRPSVVETMAAEVAILDLVGAHLEAAVPDWRIRSEDLIAYPAVPGTPGMTLKDGEQHWTLDPASEDYARRFGTLLAQLHSIDAEKARDAGVEVREPEQVRQQWREDIEKVTAHFDVHPQRTASWQYWLAEDAYWPQRTVMTHGEIYPGHVLVDENDGITGVIDWTTARVDDPARDLLFSYAIGGEEAFTVTLEAYAEAGGQPREHLLEHCRIFWSAGAVGYGLYALETGEQAHHDAAAAQLASDPDGGDPV
ncbi:macrolide 2'-phosphotransferase [Nesterenkonia cremea]|uniref:Aminoglycoside phosphotransferase n=1 Tax=Nesterenkonia cremea TaxID=1882340 RepID=A0A917AL06_9MICC|nr:macrolide 2'-phosphotransferase [Nesterenkonia cremea]GGE58351.1 aminoglycoside phosphotransferase [Nesterenkonia cremea]